MHEMLRNGEAVVQFAQYGAFWNPHIGIFHLRVIGGHVEGPHIFANFKPGSVCWHDEAGNSPRLPIVAACAGEGHHMRRIGQAGRPHLVAVYTIACHAVA